MRHLHRHDLVLPVLLVCLGLAGWAPPARAQGAAAGVSEACRAEIPRLCPESPQGRSAAICLKPFKTSLSLPCRKAVRAVFP